jgi:predicted Zn-dependent peptidase
MEERIKKYKTKSGLDVYFVLDKRFTTSTVQMCFRLGWRHDETDYTGLAHLFEHMVGKRTKNYPGKSEFDKVKDELGIVSNAYTSSNITVYHQSQVLSKTLKSLELLFEAIYNTNFLPEDLEKEKEVVLTESREYLDDDDSLIWHEMVKSVFPDTTMGKFFFGNEETMKRIDLKVFTDFYEIYKNPKNAFLVIGIDSEKESKKILKFVDEYLLKYFKENKKSKINIPVLSDKKSEVQKYREINKNDRAQANLRLAWRTKTLSVSERATFSVLRRILTSSFTSRLMKRLRDELGFVYGISLHRMTFLKDFPYVYFATKTKRENLETLEKALFEELEKAKEDITEEEVKRTIPIIEYFDQREVNIDSTVDSAINSILWKEKHITNKEFIKKLKKVKAKDVKKLLKEIFVKEESIKVLIK